MSPVGIAPSRAKACPNTTSHKIGWIMRGKSSEGSWRSFCSSTRQTVATRENRRVAVRPSAQTAGRPSSDTDIAQPSLLLPGELVAGPVPEDVLERGVRAERGLELG